MLEMTRWHSGIPGPVRRAMAYPLLPECQRVISSTEHFYGPLEIERCGSLGLCSVEYREAVEPRRAEIVRFCEQI